MEFSGTIRVPIEKIGEVAQIWASHGIFKGKIDITVNTFVDHHYGYDILYYLLTQNLS